MRMKWRRTLVRRSEIRPLDLLDETLMGRFGDETTVSHKPLLSWLAGWNGDP